MIGGKEIERGFEVIISTAVCLGLLGSLGAETGQDCNPTLRQFMGVEGSGNLFVDDLPMNPGAYICEPSETGDLTLNQVLGNTAGSNAFVNP